MLFALFTVLGLLHIPVLDSFVSGDFYQNEGIIASFTRTSIGNLGFSETQCKTSSMIAGNSKNIVCNSGVISELVDWGITTNFEDQQICMR